MWLINVRTLELELFHDENVPAYAILSHTWGDDELTFEVFSRQATTFRQFIGMRDSRIEFRKISYACSQALKDGLGHVWVDTVCINKTSSAELSEAINSMFRWYKMSSVCYAYLTDVNESEMVSDFGKCRWFTRGWTLQELIAPKSVIFFDLDWNFLGTKHMLSETISKITNINEDVIQDSARIKFYSAAAKMSWASSRHTSRKEDIAYSLLGLFSVYMPLLYGEGEHAFYRLQKEILNSSNDLSLLCWSLDREAELELLKYAQSNSSVELMAKSPADFQNAGDILNMGGGLSGELASITFFQNNIRVRLPITSCDDQSFAILPCKVLGQHNLIGIALDYESLSVEEDEERFQTCCYSSRNNTFNCLLIPDSSLVIAVPKTITIIDRGFSRISKMETTAIEKRHGFSIVLDTSLLEQQNWKLTGAFGIQPNRHENSPVTYLLSHNSESITVQINGSQILTTRYSSVPYATVGAVFLYKHRHGSYLSILVYSLCGLFFNDSVLLVSNLNSVPIQISDHIYFLEFSKDCPSMDRSSRFDASKPQNVNFSYWVVEDDKPLASQHLNVHLTPKRIFTNTALFIQVFRAEEKTDDSQPGYSQESFRIVSKQPEEVPFHAVNTLMFERPDWLRLIHLFEGIETKAFDAD